MTLALIDQGQRAELIEAVGIEDYLEIVKSLRQEVEVQIRALETRASDGSADCVKKAAHRLAGMLSQFGAHQVSAHAEKVRQAASLGEAIRHAAAMASLCRASMAAIADLPVVGAQPCGGW